jgi:hypothetical protein
MHDPINRAQRLPSRKLSLQIENAERSGYSWQADELTHAPGIDNDSVVRGGTGGDRD